LLALPLLVSCGSSPQATPTDLPVATIVATVVGAVGTTTSGAVTVAAPVVNAGATVANGAATTVAPAVNVVATTSSNASTIAAPAVNTVSTTTGGLPLIGQASVTITEPAAGATIRGPDVTVRYSASGIVIAPESGIDLPGVAHFVVILDDMPVAGQRIPKDDRHIHSTATTSTLKGVAAGPHTIRVVLASNTSVPLTNAEAQATVQITLT
ncbi:MAG: DUF4399 domain-containing protein, partial [Thermomicrobiales bacterium]